MVRSVRRCSTLIRGGRGLRAVSGRRHTCLTRRVPGAVNAQEPTSGTDTGPSRRLPHGHAL